MSVRIRILIPMIIMVVLVASAILTSNILLFSNYVDSDINNELDRALLEILNEIDMLENKAAYIASLYFSNDPAIVEALESGNREALLSRATYLYNETDVETCAIADNRGKAIVRPHAPEVYGDDLTVMHSVQSAMLGIPLTTTEGGATTDMTASASAPIYNRQGQLLGAVVVGFRIDTEEFVNKHKKNSGCEITVFRGDERVATTLLQEDGTSAIGTIAAEDISQAVLAGGTYNGQARVLGSDILTKYIPILDSDGNAIGMLFAGHFLTKKTNSVWSFITSGVLITTVFLAISVPFILLVSGHIATPINKRLEQVHYDVLTGIYNRRFFDESLNRLVKSLSRSGGILSLMMIDIDFFKKYNDKYGHSKGDDCLKAVAKALTQGVTREDDFVARYGGEEFAVVLPNTDENGARMIARKLLENVRNCNMLHEKTDPASRVTISIGVTTGNVVRTHNKENYIKRADEMLYESKKEGRNRYTFTNL